MPRIKFSEVLSFSSEDPNHPAENLLSGQNFRKWKIAPDEVGKQASVTLKLEKLSTIRSLDVGNESSAFVEVLVARDDDKYQVLLAASSFMSPLESRGLTELSRVRMFSSDKLSKQMAEQKWSRVKLVCTQPFNKLLQFGLAFVTLNAPDAAVASTTSQVSGGGLGRFTLKDEEDDSISVGSLFARQRSLGTTQTTAPPPLTGAAAIRAASQAAAAAGDVKHQQKRKTPPPHQPDDGGFYQLKKKHATGSAESSTNKPKTKDKQKDLEQKTPKQHTDSTQTQNNTKNTAKIAANPNNKNTGSNDDDSRQSNITPLPSTPSNRGPTATTSNGNNKHDNRRTVDVTRPAQSNRSANADGGGASGSHSQQQRSYKPYCSLMKGVVFVLSGYQNPRRGNLRDKMTGMGAKYKADWDGTCTHLVCAFSNTPKYNAVKGKGKIVDHRWVEDCYTFKKKVPWKRYRLDKDESSDESEDEIWAEELRPKKTLPVQKTADNVGTSSAGASPAPDAVSASASAVGGKRSSPTKASTSRSNVADLSDSDDSSSDKYSDDTDQEEDTDDEIQRALGNVSATQPPARRSTSDDEAYDTDTDVDDDVTPSTSTAAVLPNSSSKRPPLPPLLSCFTGKVFFLHNSLKDAAIVSRYIQAFDGKMSQYMGSSVRFVVTEQPWGRAFDEALKENASLQFVKPSWIWRCSDSNKLVPYQPHAVLPPSV